MSITFSEKDRAFTLHTKNTTYQMKVDQFGFLLHLYYGRRTEGCMDYLICPADRGFSGNPYDAGSDRTYSMDVIPQELPCQGTGDYRSTALIVKNADGSYGCDLRYLDHSISKGKYAIPGLPAVYADEEEAETLEIYMEDKATKIQVTLLYGVLPELDIITRSAVVQNLALMRIGMTDLPQGAFEMGTLVRFAGYSFLTSMPVLSFMVLVSSRSVNMWIPLGVGVAGFLSGMALANSGSGLLLAHPFVIMLKPAVAMSAQPDITVTKAALIETLFFLGAGLWMAKNLRYE